MNNEPVAFWNKDFDLWEENAIQTYKADGWNIPLYTHPKDDDGKVCARCGAIAYDPVITQTAKK